MNIEGDRIVFVKNEKTIELSYEQIILSLGVKANEEKVQAFADAGREVVFGGVCFINVNIRKKIQKECFVLQHGTGHSFFTILSSKNL